MLIVKLGAGGEALGSWTIGAAQEDLGDTVTAGSDGGVVAAAAPGALVTRLSADGVGLWTFTSDSFSTTVRSVAAAGGAFARAGINTGNGGSTDLVSGSDRAPRTVSASA